jgi:hypothetical protein
MSQRNGIIPSSIPFEQRYQPPDRNGGGRPNVLPPLIDWCARFAALSWGLSLWTFGYLIMLSRTMKAAARQPAAGRGIDPSERLPSFAWGGPVALGFAIFGAVVGPELMMDGFDKALHVEGEVARGVARS